MPMKWTSLNPKAVPQLVLSMKSGTKELIAKHP